FFHLDAAPGSHVVLRTEGRADPPAESLLDACELAVHFSKARRATTADVLVAPCKQVHKPPGAKPGLVQVTGGRPIRLRRDRRRPATTRCGGIASQRAGSHAHRRERGLLGP